MPFHTQSRCLTNVSGNEAKEPTAQHLDTGGLEVGTGHTTEQCLLTQILPGAPHPPRCKMTEASTTSYNAALTVSAEAKGNNRLR